MIVCDWCCKGSSKGKAFRVGVMQVLYNIVFKNSSRIRVRNLPERIWGGERWCEIAAVFTRYSILNFFIVSEQTKNNNQALSH